MCGILRVGLGSSHKNLHTDLELIIDSSEHDRLRFPRILRALCASNGHTYDIGIRFDTHLQQFIHDVIRNWESLFDPNYHISMIDPPSKIILKMRNFNLCRLTDGSGKGDAICL